MCDSYCFTRCSRGRHCATHTQYKCAPCTTRCTCSLHTRHRVCHAPYTQSPLGKPSAGCRANQSPLSNYSTNCSGFPRIKRHCPDSNQLSSKSSSSRSHSARVPATCACVRGERRVPPERRECRAVDWDYERVKAPRAAVPPAASHGTSSSVLTQAVRPPEIRDRRRQQASGGQSAEPSGLVA